MFKRHLLSIAMALSMVAIGASPSTALPGMGISKRAFLPQTTNMAERGRVSAPFGHVEFCQRNPSQCRGQIAALQSARLSRGSWRMLQQVNLKINANIRSQSDKSSRGKIDHWSASGNVGDCEDYALSKRKELIRRGWSSSSVLMATVKDRKNRSHAVLVAHTNRGDFVLDNQTGRIKAWNKTGYKWLKRQSRSNPKKWVSLSRSSGATIPRSARSARSVKKAPKSAKARKRYLLAKLSQVRARKALMKHRWRTRKSLKRWKSKRRAKRSYRKRRLTRTARLYKKSKRARRYKARRSYKRTYKSRNRANKSYKKRWSPKSFRSFSYASI